MVVGRDLCRWAARRGSKIPLWVAHRDERHRLHVLRDAQQFFHVVFPAQERSWGFVVRSRPSWDRYPPQLRAETICHEFYHQQMQMRDWLMGWTTVYWPAYMVTFAFTGWHGHWAEMQGTHAAGIVDRALHHWTPAREQDRRQHLQSPEVRRQMQKLRRQMEGIK